MTRARPAAALLAAALLSAGCFAPTWHDLQPGARPGRGGTVLVGRIAFVPPATQRGAIPSNAILVGKSHGNMAAYFSADFEEKFDPETWGQPMQEAWTAWMPLEGFFFIEVPDPVPMYLRGFGFVTDRGKVCVEAPMKLPLQGAGPVAYVGEITVVRAGERRVSVRHRLEDGRKAAEEAGHRALLAVPWSVRLAEPVR